MAPPHVTRYNRLFRELISASFYRFVALRHEFAAGVQRTRSFAADPSRLGLWLTKSCATGQASFSTPMAADPGSMR